MSTGVFSYEIHKEHNHYYTVGVDTAESDNCAYCIMRHYITNDFLENQSEVIIAKGNLSKEICIREVELLTTIFNAYIIPDVKINVIDK